MAEDFAFLLLCLVCVCSCVRLADAARARCVSTLPVSLHLARLTVYYSYILYFFHLSYLLNGNVEPVCRLPHLLCVCAVSIWQNGAKCKQTHKQNEEKRKIWHFDIKMVVRCFSLLKWQWHGARRHRYCFAGILCFGWKRARHRCSLLKHNFFKFDSLRFRFLFVRWVRFVVSREINAILLRFYAKHIGKGLKSLRGHNLNITKRELHAFSTLLIVVVLLMPCASHTDE